MTEVQVAVVGARELSVDLGLLGERSGFALQRVVTHYGHLLRTAVMRNASGSPGPNAPTGDYRRSMTVTFVRDHGSGTFSAEVGTNAPQGRRLEFGFVGADSLGRVYNQRPRPHFGPAFDSVAPEFEAAIGRAALG